MTFKQFYNRACMLNSAMICVAIVILLMQNHLAFAKNPFFQGYQAGVFALSLSNLFFFTWHVMRLRTLQKLNIGGTKNVSWKNYYETFLRMPHKRALSMLFSNKDKLVELNKTMGMENMDLNKDSAISSDFAERYVPPQLERLVRCYQQNLNITKEEARALFIFLVFEYQGKIISEYSQNEREKSLIHLTFDNEMENLGKRFKSDKEITFGSFDAVVNKLLDGEIKITNEIENMTIGYIDFIFKNCRRLEIADQSANMVLIPFISNHIYFSITKDI